MQRDMKARFLKKALEAEHNEAMGGASINVAYHCLKILDACFGDEMISIIPSEIISPLRASLEPFKIICIYHVRFLHGNNCYKLVMYMLVTCSQILIANTLAVTEDNIRESEALNMTIKIEIGVLDEVIVGHGDFCLKPEVFFLITFLNTFALLILGCALSWLYEDQYGGIGLIGPQVPLEGMLGP
ncbi:hypothetical protein ACJX0J_036235 [Zea mays]